MIMDVQVGISREGLSKKRLSEFLIPLPPLNEQRRIVAKVDELMQLCDDLEAQVKDGETYAGLLLDAVLREAFNS
jgi:type I restriction enzyme, S subunit